MGIIDTASTELLPCADRCGTTNLARVGGVTRIYDADIAPDDSLLRRDERVGWRRTADQ